MMKRFYRFAVTEKGRRRLKADLASAAVERHFGGIFLKAKASRVGREPGVNRMERKCGMRASIQGGTANVYSSLVRQLVTGRGLLYYLKQLKREKSRRRKNTC